MNEKKWNNIRQFYMESFGIAPELVDLMASNEVVLMCVSGSSNESISSILNMDIESISEILDVILSFSGWTKDLEFNPYNYYKEDSTLIGFIGSIREACSDDTITLDIITTMYNICKTYDQIEGTLDRDWV